MGSKLLIIHLVIVWCNLIGAITIEHRIIGEELFLLVHTVTDDKNEDYAHRDDFGTILHF